MSEDNHAKFAKQVLRGVAHLYRTHPVAGALAHQQVCKPALAEGDRDEEDFASGTIRWLYDNGVVRGDMESTNAGVYLYPAQLTAF